MTSEPQDLQLENALLRGSLWLTARALKGYHDSKHTTTDDGLQLTVPESLREKAAEALARAEKMLKEPEQGRGR
jgi:hypothetical protein